MKMKFKRASKSTLSIILAIMMVLSTMLIGTISISAATTNFTGGNTIYFKPNANWLAFTRYAVDFYNAAGHQWVALYDNDSDGYFSATIPSGNWDRAIFCRIKAGDQATLTDEELAKGGTGWIGDNNFWNKTKDLEGESGKNCYTLGEGSWSDQTDTSGGSWSTYTTGGGDTSSNWYLGGWINDAEVGFSSSDYKFESVGNDIYKLANVTFTSNTQYVVVNDGSTTYLSNGGTSTEANPYDNKWLVDSSSTKTFDFTWNASNKTLTWEASVVETFYSITNNASGVEVTPVKDNYSEGDAITITPTDNSKKITKVTGTNLPTTITYNDDGTATFSMPAKDVTISSVTLEDKIKKYTITNNASGVSVNPTTDILESAPITITPTDTNKKITNVTGTNLPTVTYNDDGSATFAMPANNVTISSVTLEDKSITYYILGPAVTGNDSDWNSKNIQLKSENNYTYTINSADDFAKDKPFLISNSADTTGNVKASGTDGNGVKFTKDGDNLKYSLDSGYTYPVTITYDKNQGTNGTLSGSATPQSSQPATYHVVEGTGEDAIEMTETYAGSGIYVSTSSINNGNYFTIRKTVGTDKTYAVAAASGNQIWINSESTSASINSWSGTYSDHVNVYVNNCGSAKYVYYDSTQGTNGVIYLKANQDTSASSWYLTGYLDKIDVDDAKESYALKQSQTNPNEYTLTYTFTSSGDGNQYVVIHDEQNNKWYHPYENKTGSGEAADLSNTKGPRENPKWKVEAGVGSTVDFTWNASTKTLSWTVSTSGVIVYAKDCTFGTDDNGKLGLDYGDTTLINSDTVKEFDVLSTDTTRKYKTYNVEKGSYVTIRSTMPASYYKEGKGYYVAGFVVNGETVSITNETKDKSGNGIFDGYCVLDERFIDKNSIVEITPVYFNRTIEDNGDYVYFTVDAKDVPDTWGNTTSAYSYYYNPGKDSYKMDGVWPGQPLLKTKTGVYWTMVSKYYYDANSTKVAKSDGSFYAMSGVSFSNYCRDYVHSQRGYNNCQTYDYNVPTVAIAQGYDTISFATEYRNKTYNLNVDKNSFNPDQYQNGWDVYLDYKGDQKIDILGNVVTDETKKKMYIVSTGDNNITGIGEWATIFYVFSENDDGTYTKVTEGNPSAFIDPTTDQYKKLNVDQYKGRPTYITYEKLNNKENSADRIDGRWYYHKAEELEVSVNLQSQYYDESTKEYVVDKTGVSGTATIDGVAPDENGISSKTFQGLGSNAQIVATPKDGYVFEGWYWVDTKGGTDPSQYEYTKLTLITEPTETILVNSNLFIVARFKPIAHGSLVLTHTAKPGSGLGYYSITAQVKDAGGTNVGTPLSGSSVTISQISAGQSVEITLKTRMAGINVFENWYGYDYSKNEYYIIGDEVSPDPNAKEVTYTFTLDAADIFNGDTQLVTTLNYYSNITTVTADAVLNYQYQDRNNTTKTYTTKVKLTPEYIDTYGYSLNNAEGSKIIYENAPAIQDLYKNVKWSITENNATYSGTTVTLKAIPLDKTYTLTVVDGDNPEVSYSNLPYNTLMADDALKTDKNPSGLTICAQGEKFSYWKVTNTAGVEIGKTYSKYFNLRIVEDCTITAVYNVEIANDASISDPTFTREQYTEGNKQLDYLYADFVVSYTAKDGTIIKDNPNRFKTGIILEYDTGVKITADNQSIEGKTFNDAASLADVIKLDNGKYVITQSGSGKQIAYNYVIDSTKYNNMNRLDYYLKFNNKTESYRYYVMKAYYYVVDTQTGETVYSDPVYFNLYNVATSEPNREPITQN